MRRSLTIAATLLALVATGCGGTDDSTPVACLEGSGTYLRALQAAPGAVRLRGKTPISGCLTENQQGGALATVGATMVKVATKLNAEARAEPGGAANVQLGYLLGAAQRGSEHTDGIHAELMRRLSTAAGYSPGDKTLPLSFLRGMIKGVGAGKTSG